MIIIITIIVIIMIMIIMIVIIAKIVFNEGTQLEFKKGRSSVYM